MHPNSSAAKYDLGVSLEGVRFDGITAHNYRFERCLGQGGAAPVWSAIDTIASAGETQKRVAIKLFACAKGSGKDYGDTISKLRDDLLPLVQLHETDATNNIVEYITTIEDEGQIVQEKDGISWFYQGGVGAPNSTGQSATIVGLVMEFVQGGSLEKSEYRRYCVLSSGRFLSEIADLARCLHGAHHQKRHVIHCDIKPHNIFWSYQQKTSRLLLGDWGIARQLHELGFVGYSIGGTPEYMSPESFGDAAPDWQRDAYAFGCTLYHLFAGRAPFQQSDHNELKSLPREEAYARLHLEYPRPAIVGRECSELHATYGLENLIRRLLDVDPANRPSLEASADILLAESRHYRKAADRIEELHVEGVEVPLIPRADLNPTVTSEFRWRARHQRPYIIGLEIPSRSKRRLQELFGVLEHFFGAHYCCTETFGRFDFVIKVWDSSDGSNVLDMCHELTRRFHDRARSRLQILPCSEEFACGEGAHRQLAESVDIASVMRSLFRLQSLGAKNWNEEDFRLVKVLEKEGVLYLSSKAKLRSVIKLLDPFLRARQEERIPCYCFVRGEGDRRGLAEKVIRLFERHAPKDLVESIRIYEPIRRDIGEFESIDALLAVYYIAKSYPFVRTVPKYILTSFDLGFDLNIHALTTWTLPATKNYAVISEAMELVPDGTRIHSVIDR